MKTARCQSQSEGATRALGNKLASQLENGGTILLRGELGAGKTTFVQGMATGLGIVESVTSPTFALVAEYQVTHRSGIDHLIHIDLYRVYSETDIVSLDITSYQADPKNLIVVEWPERAPGVWQNVLGTIQFESRELHQRELVVTGDLMRFFK